MVQTAIANYNLFVFPFSSELAHVMMYGWIRAVRYTSRSCAGFPHCAGTRSALTPIFTVFGRSGDRFSPVDETAKKLEHRGASWLGQEEVAARMAAYGYDFHQTMIAKIEAAQRPLRVRELADFAALYGVEVQDLVYPPTTSLPQSDQEIVEVTASRARAIEARRRLEPRP